MVDSSAVQALPSWPRILANIAEDVQRASTVPQMADIIVRGGCALGFARARLWLLIKDDQMLQGAAQQGNNGLVDFDQFRMPLSESPYTQHVLDAREPLFFTSQELGPWMLSHRFGSRGFAPPRGEWAHIPLWAGERCWGILSLDNGDQAGVLSDDQRAVLTLFGRQVAAALEQARLITEGEQQREALDWLEVLINVASDVQRALSLQEVADIITLGGLQLGFERTRLWLLSEDGSKIIGIGERGNQGLDDFVGSTVAAHVSPYMRHVLESKEPVFFRAEEFGPSYLHAQHAAQGYLPPTGEWVGLPLLSDNVLRGVLMLDNSTYPARFQPEVRQLLTLFGRHAAAALDRARKSHEREWLQHLIELASKTQQAQTLHDVGRLLVLGAQELGFERARLWLHDAEQDALIGLCEVGNTGLPPFETLCLPLSETSYGLFHRDRAAIQVLQELEEGQSYLVRHFAQQGFLPPVGEWVNLPLWSNQRLLGLLSLDNVRHARVLYPGQRDILDLLRRQAESALERVRLYEEEQRQRSEGVWLRLLADVSEKVQQARSTHDVAEAIVDGAQCLAFARARLWLLSDDQRDLVGFCEAGNQGLATFPGFRLSIVGSRYVHDVLPQREPVLLRGRDKVPALLDEGFAAYGFSPPQEWLCVPLWGSESCLGMLALDNGPNDTIHPEQRTLVSLFGRQAAAALERARRTSERDWLRILTRVAADAQQTLGLRETVDRLLMGCRKLGFERVRLWHLSEDGQTMIGFAQVGNQGLGQFIGYKVPLAESPYMQQSTIQHQPRVFNGREAGPSILDQQFASTGFEAPVGEWVELSLWIGQQLWGVLTLDNARKPQVLSDEQRVLLPLLSSQLTAAIERASRYEKEQGAAHDLRVISTTERALPRLAHPDDDEALWHALLMTICAPFGLNFGRATLLLLETSGSRLREHVSLGRSGHSIDDPLGETHAALSVEEYINYLHQTSYHIPLVQPVRSDWTLDLAEGNLLASLLAGDQAATFIAPNDLEQLLPRRFIEHFGKHACMLLPLGTAERPLGIVVIDDSDQQARSCHAIRDDLLHRIQELLKLGVRVRESVRERQAREHMIELTYPVIADLGDRPVLDVLQLICHTARQISGADSVVLYPLSDDGPHDHYDRQLIVADGLAQPLQLRKKSHPDAITQRVLRAGRLDHTQLDPRVIAAHPLLQREGIKAFIGVEIRAPRSNSRGVLFINFRRPHTFSEFEGKQAQTFATLAALAISNARTREKMIDQHRALGVRELEILQAVQKQAFSTTTVVSRQRAFIRRLLLAARDLIDRNDVTVSLIQVHTWPQADPQQTPRRGRKKYYLDDKNHLEILDDLDLGIEQGISGRVLRSGQSQYVADVTSPSWCDIYVPGLASNTRSELDVPVKSRGSGGTIGVFNLESTKPDAFSKTHQEMIERLATVASLALLNLQRQQTLDDALATATALGPELRLVDVVRKALEQLRTLFPDAQLFLLTYNPADRVLEFPTESRLFYPIDDATFSRLRRVPLDGPSIASEVARQTLATGEAQLINQDDVRHRQSYLPVQPHTRSKLCVSLMRGDDLLGVVGLESGRLNAFTREDETLVRLVSQQIGLALDRANQSAQLNFTTSVAVRTLWAAELAHDINSEVGHMRLIIDSLKHRPEMSEASLQKLDAVDQRAKRMAQILDGVRHDGELHGEPVLLDSMLRETLEGIDMGSVTIHYDLRCAGVLVQAQPMVLQRALLHLARNAREALRDRVGGRLTVRSSAEEHIVEIQFENNGASIPAEIRNKLLNEPFTTKQRAGGLGLVFVRMMIEGMGGTVRLLPDTLPEGGAAFALTLPIVRQRPLAGAG